MNVTVVGLGKIGLPLAVQFARAGMTVIGADSNASVVSQVNAGVEPFPGEGQLADYLGAVVDAGKLSATTDTTDAVSRSDVVVVVVPLFVDADARPEFTAMDSATEDIGRGLRAVRRPLVCYETTLPVGTTRQRWRPMLEQASGLREGRDFDVVFSPERVLTGRVFQDLRRYPKLVGGLSQDGAARAVAFYENALEFDERPDLRRRNGVWDLGSAEAAELAKLAETTYRDVNIGLANQFARFAAASGIDIYKVIEASNSQPYSHIHQPGMSVGGHCIPVYPRLYLWNDPDATIVREARAANAQMPAYTVGLARAAVGGDLRGLRVAVLGAAYRAGAKELAFSGVFDAVRELSAGGAQVSVHDPLFTDAELRHHGWTPHRLGEPADVAIVHTDHAGYASLTAEDFPGLRVLVDGRNRVDPAAFPGVTVVAVGRPPLTASKE